MSQLLHCDGQGGWSCIGGRRGGRQAQEYDWEYRHADRRYGRGIVFKLPPRIKSVGAAALLKRLGDDSGARGAKAEQRLAELIDENAQRLDLPDAVLVTDRQRTGDDENTELIDVLTVLTKASGRLFLRSKTPNIQSITPDRQVVVILPPKKSLSKRRRKR